MVAKRMVGGGGVAGAAASRALDGPELAIGTAQVEKLHRDDLLDNQDLACLVHDLKTPLATIDLEAQLIERRQPDAATKRGLSVIRQNAAFMDRLVRNLLDLPCSERGLRTQRCALGTVIERVVERSVSPPDQHRILLELCSVLVFADPIQIERVVANLLDNALRYSKPRSRVVIRLEVHLDHACVSVIDTGPGLSPADAGLVFDRYHRGPDRADGTGLGLYVSKRIVEGHRGRIGVETLAGRGSRFFFEIPLAGAPGTIQIAPDRLAGVRILCIDDDSHQSIANTLRRAGAVVEIAQSSNDAIMRALAWIPDHPDAVVIDLDRVDSGSGLLLSLRATMPGLPALMMTGLPPDHPTVSRAVRIADVRCIEKPVEPELIIATLEQVLA